LFLNQEKMMAQYISGKRSAGIPHPVGITIVAVIIILFGLAEVGTGFTHNFIGVVSTSETSISTYLGVALGLFYFTGGVLILTKRKWAAITAIVLLCGDVIGRVSMVMAGLYPVNSFKQTFAIIIGTLIAVFFVTNIGLKLKFFE
jgi:hypothetical protein